MPWILCGPNCPDARRGDSVGSTATTCTAGLPGLQDPDRPGDRTPVPMPATRMSTAPCVSSQISTAVVRSIEFRDSRRSRTAGTSTRSACPPRSARPDVRLPPYPRPQASAPTRRHSREKARAAPSSCYLAWSRSTGNLSRPRPTPERFRCCHWLAPRWWSSPARSVPAVRPPRSWKPRYDP